MSAKLWSLEDEVKALKTILTVDSKWAHTLFADCRKEYFFHRGTKRLFKRLKKIMEESQVFPTYEFLISDSNVDSGTKEVLKESFAEAPLVQSDGDYHALVGNLKKFALSRKIFSAAQKTADSLTDDEEEKDLAAIIDELGSSIMSMDSGRSENPTLTIGKGYDAFTQLVLNKVVNGELRDGLIPSGFKEFDEKTGGFRRTNLVILSASSGGGKCVHGSCLVPTTFGIFRIEDLWAMRGADRGKGWSELRVGVQTREGVKYTDGVFRCEAAATVKITTEISDEFQGLGDHKLLALDEDTGDLVFKRLDEIKVGDFLPKSLGAYFFPEDVPNIEYKPSKYTAQTIQDVTEFPVKMTKNLAALFALIVAEGSRAISFTNFDQELLRFFQDSLKRNFGCHREIKEERCIVFKQVVGDYFSKFCGDVRSADRFVPKCILQSPKEIQVEFLRYLWEGDGTIYRKIETRRTGKDNRWSLEYTTISHQLAYEVKAMLENLGIGCRVRTKQTWASNGTQAQQSKPGYTLFVWQSAVHLFEQEVGFVSERKRQELSNYTEHLRRVYNGEFLQNTNHLIHGPENKIPSALLLRYVGRLLQVCAGLEIEVGRSRKGRLFFSKRKASKWCVFWNPETRESYRSNVEAFLKKNKPYTSKYFCQKVTSEHRQPWVNSKVAQVVEEDAELQSLRAKITKLSQEVWVQVTETEVINKKEWVYDLSVPGPHEYSANGLMSHNSLMSVNLLVRQYLEGYNVALFSYEMSEEEVLIRVLSIISEVDMNKISLQKMDMKERNRVLEAFYRFIYHGQEKNCAFHIVCPHTATTMTDVLFKLKGFDVIPDSVILDYINLMESEKGGEAQWQELGNIAREAKMMANKLNCVVYLLAQLDEAYSLRYSKGIRDHANFIWGWVRSQDGGSEDVDQRLIDIHQLKARNAPLYNFTLGERFDIGQFRDLDQIDREDWLPQREQAKLFRKYEAEFETSVSRILNPGKKVVPDEVEEKREPTPPLEAALTDKSSEDYIRLEDYINKPSRGGVSLLSKARKDDDYLS